MKTIITFIIIPILLGSFLYYKKLKVAGILLIVIGLLFLATAGVFGFPNS